MHLLLLLSCMSEPAERVATPVAMAPAHATELVSVDGTPETVPGLIAHLADEQTSQDALAALIAHGDEAVPALEEEARRGDDITARGWAIQALAQIDSPEAEQALDRLVDVGDPLVLNWVQAGRIQQADTLDELIALSPLQRSHPAVARPFQAKAQGFADEVTDTRDAIVLLNQDNGLASVVAPTLQKASVKELTGLMFHDVDQGVRRSAAGLLASRSDDARAIARQYAYTPGADEVLWSGGALYVPNLGWQKREATILVGHLVSWYVFCDRNNLHDEKNQVMNNLNSLGLVHTVGMPWPSRDAKELLVQYGQATSYESARKIVADHGLLDNATWTTTLDRI